MAAAVLKAQAGTGDEIAHRIEITVSFGPAVAATRAAMLMASRQYRHPSSRFRQYVAPRAPRISELSMPIRLGSISPF
jgi:hypothetical protein